MFVPVPHQFSGTRELLLITAGFDPRGNLPHGWFPGRPRVIGTENGVGIRTSYSTSYLEDRGCVPEDGASRLLGAKGCH